MSACEADLAIVLAAGRGTRMGGPKALTATPAGVWWRVQAMRLREAEVDVIWVVSETVKVAMEREKDAPERLVVSDPQMPMFASVVAGLRAVGAGLGRGVFVLPVDTPAPGPVVWGALAAGAGHAGAVPVFEGRRGHPVYLTRGFVGQVLRRCDAESDAITRLRLDEMLARGVSEVPVGDRTVAINLNTRDDVRSMFEAGGALAPGACDRETT